MILNQTTNQIISTKERYCNSFLSQALGLMFRKKQNLVMKFNRPKTVSLHMFFVFYPIDVILLNEDKEVIEIKRHLKPFTSYNFRNKAKYVIETSELELKVNLMDKLSTE